MNTLQRHIALESRKRLEAKIYGPKKSIGPLEVIRSVASNVIDVPIKTIEVHGMKIAYLPIGITMDHINGMVRAGKVDTENIFIGEEACGNAKINMNIPQIFGYTIIDDWELERVITDRTVLKSAQESAKKFNKYPTIFLGNHQARLAHANYLGGRVPTQEEQRKFWSKLSSGTDNLTKARRAGIPFLGSFTPNICEFIDVGDSVSLVSSSLYSNGNLQGLHVERDKSRKSEEGWYHPEAGYSSVVLFN